MQNMYENKKKVKPEDYKERFEFRLTFGENDTPICQRYFRIRDFNQKSYGSRDLAETLRYCARLIDDDLKAKSAIYLEHMAPQVFNTEEEMFEYYKDGAHSDYIEPGHGIVIRDEKAPNYAWSGRKKAPIPVEEKFDFGEYSTDNIDTEKVELKLALYDEGRLVCATCWNGYYPREVRKNVDLSNDVEKILYGRKVSELSLRESVYYKMAEGRNNIIRQIIDEFCEVCSMPSKDYDRYEVYGKGAKGKNKKYDYGYCFERYKLEAEANQPATTETGGVKKKLRAAMDLT